MVIYGLLKLLRVIENLALEEDWNFKIMTAHGVLYVTVDLLHVLGMLHVDN